MEKWQGLLSKGNHNLFGLVCLQWLSYILQVGSQNPLACYISQIADMQVIAMPCISTVHKSVLFHMKSDFSIMEIMFWLCCKPVEPTKRIWHIWNIWQLSQSVNIVIPEWPYWNKGNGNFLNKPTIGSGVFSVTGIQFASKNLQASWLRHF